MLVEIADSINAMVHSVSEDNSNYISITERPESPLNAYSRQMLLEKKNSDSTNAFQCKSLFSEVENQLKA